MLKQLGVASVRLEVSLQNLEEVSRKIKEGEGSLDRKSTRLNSRHTVRSYAGFCLKKKKKTVNPGDL